MKNLGKPSPPSSVSRLLASGLAIACLQPHHKPPPHSQRTITRLFQRRALARLRAPVRLCSPLLSHSTLGRSPTEETQLRFSRPSPTTRSCSATIFFEPVANAASKHCLSFFGSFSFVLSALDISCQNSTTPQTHDSPCAQLRVSANYFSSQHLQFFFRFVARIRVA